ncbi:Regulator of nonsense-mediated decay, UPF3 [Metarhizium album ARSEF 1941]|uniref:Regulator of nonsense-mediated decay, UPF3 n=1 Tax=Metarhizium album (strain ARSEF 1941) TaxID=1081103 RepID=A0A0B2WXI9_METAS|nr:Regulator of nonsense-mediated decay, UPF3 [Metarhizium album ARSEF 1941]KHN98274.1 Regulator of nonsense-mediated decay, UPF3 [Metarhizium album ARSEF 1941]
MSTQLPQVLSRRANGQSGGATGRPSDQIRMRQRVKASQVCGDQSFATHQIPASDIQVEQVKDNDAAGHISKPAKGRGHTDRRGGASKSANDGEGPPKAARSKPQNEGEKVVVRRLPPGMTKQEFISIVGPEWEVSRGKVDWFSYVAGKISTDPSKPSRPGRAYLHLMRKDDIMPLSEIVRNATWEDAKSTFTNPSLVGPPVLEFSIYKKVPGLKKRTDARQGTIDQDPEFMAFLEGLANPAPLRESIDVEDAEDSAKVDIKVTTPLVEFLKERKASKGKDGSGKNSKPGKGKGGAKDDDTSGRKKGKESRTEKHDKTPKETVKILTKKAAAEQAAEGAKKAASQTATSNASTTTAAAATDAPKSRRAGIAAAARILQRDLGLSPGSAHRRARHDAAKADTKAASSSVKDDDGAASDVTNTASATALASGPAKATILATKTGPDSPVASKPQPGRRNRGGKGGAEKSKSAANEASGSRPAATNPPVILKKRKDAENSERPAESRAQASGPATTNGNGKQTAKEKADGKAASQKKSSPVSANATRAFVKHANAAQGVNDATLREALGAFGAITLVEVDKRKGFAYVDFSEHDALVRAVAASPVQVGQASVQVLERKDKKLAAAAATPSSPAKDGQAPNGEREREKSSGGRGRRGRGGGGKTAADTTNGQAAAGPTPASTGG